MTSRREGLGIGHYNDWAGADARRSNSCGSDIPFAFAQGRLCPRLLISAFFAKPEQSSRSQIKVKASDKNVRPYCRCRSTQPMPIHTVRAKPQGLADPHGPRRPTRLVPVPMFIRHRQGAHSCGRLRRMTSQTLASALEGFLSGSSGALVREDGAVIFDLAEANIPSPQEQQMSHSFLVRRAQPCAACAGRGKQRRDVEGDRTENRAAEAGAAGDMPATRSANGVGQERRGARVTREFWSGCCEKIS